MARHGALSLAAALGVLGAAGPAAAEQACGYSSSGWSAPNGAVVFSRSETGPVTAVLSTLGEYRTHSMLSHGPGRAVTHSTMRTPEQNGWPALCKTPIKPDQLRDGYPGLERVNQGGIYQFLYGGGDNSFLAYQLGDPARAALIADHVLWDYALAATPSLDDSSQNVYQVWAREGRAPYGLYQYRDVEGTNWGGPSVNNGMVCSTFLSFAHHAAGENAVSPFTYAHATIAAASNALYSNVRGECKGSLGFWGSVGAAVGCPIFWDVCSNAANQVVNCMATNSCGSSDGGKWKSVRDDPHATATSISPDRLGGWAGHSWGGPDDAVWSADWNNPVQWNSGGNVYGCWQ